MDDQEVPQTDPQDISPANQEQENEPSASPEKEKPGRQEHIDDAPAGDEMAFVLAPEELPTMQWPDIDAEMAKFEREQEAAEPDLSSSPLQGLEEAMSWLEQLAAGQGVPIDEMPTLVTTQPVDDADVEPDAETKSPPERGAKPDDRVVSLDSDPMAWLEQLAVEQSSPLEELPSVADRLLASDIVSQTEIAPDSSINNPVDVQQAIDYLEQLAETQGINISSIRIESDTLHGSLEEVLLRLDSLALMGLVAKQQDNGPQPAGEADAIKARKIHEELREALQQDGVDDFSAEMPDDPQEALRWLSDLGIDSGDPVEVVNEADTAGSSALVEEAQDSNNIQDQQVGSSDEQADVEASDDADVLAEMPDDPDEAMAWMESLATRSEPNETEQNAPETGTNEAAQWSVNRTNDLQAAQRALDNDDLPAALDLFRSIIDAGQADQALLDLLELSVERRGETPQLLRLLGDAYMQAGDVNKAVDTYRRGFDHL